MNEPQLESWAMAVASTSGVRRGVIERVLPDGLVCVSIHGDPRLHFACDVLQSTGHASAQLEQGMSVLALVPASDEELGCVLGVVGPYSPPNVKTVSDQDSVTVTAKGKLELRCGESSLTLDETGKILLKGVDIVTRAKRNQKIKAGTVSIN